MKRTVMTLTLLPMLTALAAGPASRPASESAVAIPRGAAIRIDGIQSPVEWKTARIDTLAPTGRFRLQQDGKWLYAGLEGSGDGWGHVYAVRGDTLRILHASAALGTAVYIWAGDSWRLVRNFEWDVRDTSQSPEALAERTAFLKSEGWVASTNRMGRKGEIEYQISLDLFDPKDPRLALMWMPNADSPNVWPAGLRDDTRHHDILFGRLPDRAAFHPERWAGIQIDRR